MVADARRLAALALAVCLTGCATTGARPLSARFITEGTPSVDLGGMAPAKPAAARTRLRPSSRDYAISYDVSRPGGGASALETRDGALRNAVLEVQLMPSAGSHLRLAQAYLKAGITDQAFDHLKQSVLLDVRTATAHDLMARMWRDWGLPGNGLADAHRALHYAPTSAAARNTLGTLLLSLGQRREAEAAFREALAVDPRAWFAARNLCDSVMRDGRTKEAIPLCRLAETLEADYRPRRERTPAKVKP
jgi:Flp pilus assembly protein TadD